MNRRLQPVTAPTGPPRRDDRGSESVELAILLPVGILILAMLVIGARIALAGDRVSGVAGIAARDASLARSAAAAQQTATASAAIHARFITPPTNSRAISAQQQPTHSKP